MNLHKLFQQRAVIGNKPLRVGLIGAGKFGATFLAQAQRTAGLHIQGVADLSPERARKTFARIGWAAERIGARTLSEAVDKGTTWIGTDTAALISHPAIDVVIDSTGHPPAGVSFALQAIANGKHIVMVNVEADALAGPLLAKKARDAGIIYSLAYGDQPAMIAEQVDWARTCGFDVVAAGKGTKHMPSYHYSTPETVWDHFGISAEDAQIGGMNSQMYNSFLDGTKSAIEMAAVANATGLAPAPDGLAFMPCGTDDLAHVLRPISEGGQLHHKGQVEVVSSLELDGRPVYRDMRWGVFVVFEAPDEYVKRCFREYHLVTDPSGRYAARYTPIHVVGLELGITVANVGLRRESTGAAIGFHGDAVAIAKHDLNAGDTLDGEGGYTVWGKLMPAADSLRIEALPVGLAHHVTMRGSVKKGHNIRWSDVIIDDANEAVQVRREMETVFAPQGNARTAE